MTDEKLNAALRELRMENEIDDAWQTTVVRVLKEHDREDILDEILTEHSHAVGKIARKYKPEPEMYP